MFFESLEKVREVFVSLEVGFLVFVMISYGVIFIYGFWKVDWYELRISEGYVFL